MRALRGQDRDLVTRDLLVVRDDRQALDLGLRDEHAVEEICMVPRELPSRDCVLGCHGERREARQRQRSEKIAGSPEPALCTLDLDLPGRYRAHEDVVGWICEI